MIPDNCVDCINPPEPPPQLHPQARPPPLLVGHVCTIFESLATPAEHILRDSPGIKDNPILLKRCEDALAAIQKPGSRIGKNRPCIILDTVTTHQQDMTGISLILLGTFESTPFDELPSLYQFFLVAIPPNPHAANNVHFHIVPQWDNMMQWAVAYIIKSTRPLKGLWPRARYETSNPHANSPSPKRVGEKPIYRATPTTRGMTRDTCGLKLTEWSEECLTKPEFALRHEQNYRVCSVRPFGIHNDH